MSAQFLEHSLPLTPHTVFSMNDDKAIIDSRNSSQGCRGRVE